MLNNYFNVTIAILFIGFLVVYFLLWRYSKENIWKDSYYLKKSIFTDTELKFYNWLNAFLINHNLNNEYLLFSKIRMADIFYSPSTWNSGDNKKYIYKILAKHIDFIITDKKWAPVLLLELDDKFHSWRKYYRSDELKNDISKYTGIPLLRFTASNYYKFDSVLHYL